MSEMKYPIQVQKIEFKDEESFVPTRYGKQVCGQMVSIRPCGPEFEGKTFLGILLGDIAVSQGCQFYEESGTLKVFRTMYNPAVFIPDKNAVVFGYESWWGTIKSAEELRQITDEDINNVWYVKALKQLTEESDSKHV